MDHYSLEERFDNLRSTPLNSSAYKGESSNTNPILYPTIPAHMASRDDYLRSEQPAEGSPHPSSRIEDDLGSIIDYIRSGKNPS